MLTANRKIVFELPPLTTKLEGVAGVPGGVLPKGVLPALMKSATTHDQMYTLCHAVLRRYATRYGCFPNPPHFRRTQAYETIRRAWERAEVELLLRKLPHDFWNGELPPPPEKDVPWPVTEKVKVPIGNKNVHFGRTMPLDHLLNPDSWAEELSNEP